MGFSLIELAVVLAVAGILLMLGVPSFAALINHQKMTTTVNDFFAAINLARSEAIQRGGRVDLVPLDAADWSKGWIVFVDRNNNQRPDPGEQIIFSHGPVPDGIKIRSVLTDSTVQYLAYNGSGRTRTNASSQSPQFGTWSFIQDKQIRRIKVNFLGRPRTCNPDQDATCTGIAGV